MLWLVTAVIVGTLSFVQDAPARDFTWTLGSEPDLAGYRLFMQVGACANNTASFKQVKQVGVQNHMKYQPVTYGTYCFYLKAFDTGGNVSTRSNKVQLN